MIEKNEKNEKNGLLLKLMVIFGAMGLLLALSGSILYPGKDFALSVLASGVSVSLGGMVAALVALIVERRRGKRKR